MSDDKEIANVEGENEVESNYQPPPQKTIEEIIAADQEDESLRKYKEALLGAAQSEKIIVGECTAQLNLKKGRISDRIKHFLILFFADANDPRKVIVKKLALCVPGRDDMELDLSGDISKLKKQVSVRPRVFGGQILNQSIIVVGIHHKRRNSVQNSH